MLVWCLLEDISNQGDNLTAQIDKMFFGDSDKEMSGNTFAIALNNCHLASIPGCTFGLIRLNIRFGIRILVGGDYDTDYLYIQLH